MTLLNLDNPIDVARYSQFVQTSPFGQVTQDVSWSQVKQNWIPYYFYHENKDHQIDAALSLLTIAAVDGGTLAYATRGPVADMHNIASVKSLVQEAVDTLPKDTFLIRMDPEIAFDEALNQQYIDAGFITRNTAITAMHGTIQPRKNVVMVYENNGQPIATQEELMLHFKSDYRNQIRRSFKEGVEVQSGTTMYLIDAFYDLYVKMAKAQNISYRPKSYFDQMQKTFSTNPLFRVFVAYLNKKPIAAGIGFGYGDEIWYMYAGSDREYSKYYGPYAVQWYMINWGFDLKKKRYDFGGVGEFDANDGLYKFKHGFAYHDPNQEYIGEIDWVINQEKYQQYIKQFE